MEPTKKWTSTYFQEIAQCGQELVVLITQISYTQNHDEAPSKTKLEDLYERLNVKGSEMSQLCTSKLRKRNQNMKGTGITVPENLLVQIERSSTDFLLKVAEVEKAIKDIQNKKVGNAQNPSLLASQNTLLSSSSSSLSSSSKSSEPQYRASLTSERTPHKEKGTPALPPNDTECTTPKDHFKECLDELLSSLKRLLLVGSQITKVESKRQVPPIILGCKSRTTPSLIAPIDNSSSSASGSSSSLVSLSSNSLVVLRPPGIDPTMHGAAVPGVQESIEIVKSESEKLVSVLEKYSELLKGQLSQMEMVRFQELTRPLTESYQKIYNAIIAHNVPKLAEEFKDRCSLLLGLLKAVAAKPDDADFKMHASDGVLSLIEYKNVVISELLRTFSSNDSASVATDITNNTSNTSSSSSSNNSGGNCSDGGKDRTSDYEYTPPNYNISDYDKSSSSSDSDSLSSVSLLSPSVPELEHVIRVKNDLIARLKKTIDVQAEEIRSLADTISMSPPCTPPPAALSSGDDVVCDVLKAREEAVHRREEALDSLYENYNNDLDDYKRKHGAFTLEKKKCEKEKKRLREERARIKEAKDSVQRDLALVREERRQLEAQRAAGLGCAICGSGKHTRRATSPLEVGKFANSAAVAAVKIKRPSADVVGKECLYKFASEYTEILTRHFPGFASEWKDINREKPIDKTYTDDDAVALEGADDSGISLDEKSYQRDLDALVDRFSADCLKTTSSDGLYASDTETDYSDNDRRERREKRSRRRSHKHRKSSSSGSKRRKDRTDCDDGKQEESGPKVVIASFNEGELKENVSTEEEAKQEVMVDVEIVKNNVEQKCVIECEKDEKSAVEENSEPKIPTESDVKGTSKDEELAVEVNSSAEPIDVEVSVGDDKGKYGVVDESYSSFDEFSSKVTQGKSSLGSSTGSEYGSTASSNSSEVFEYGNPISNAFGLCQHFYDILREKVNLKAIFRWNRVLVEFRLLRAMFPGYVASQKDSGDIDDTNSQISRYHSSVMQIASKFGNVTVKTSTSIVTRLTAEIISGTMQKEPTDNRKNIEHSRKYLLSLLRLVQADVADLKSSEALVKISNMVIANIERIDITGTVNKDLIAAAEHSQHLREVILTEVISSISVYCGHVVTLTSQILAVVCRLPFALDNPRTASAPLWELCTCAYRFVNLLAGLATRYETSKCLRAVLCASKANPSFFVIHNAGVAGENGESAHESEASISSKDESVDDGTNDSEHSLDNTDEKAVSPLWSDALQFSGKSMPHFMSLNELIYRITDPTNIDALSLRTAVVTSLSYAEPKVFLGKLIERFNAPSWVDESTVVKVRTRVILVLTHFIEAQFDDFDAETLRMLQDFIDGPIMHSSAALGVILRKDYERKARVSRQRLLVTQIPTTTLTISPSPRSPLELFFELDEVTVARQLTMATFAIFSSIEPKELLEQAWAKPKLQYRAQNVVRLIERSKLLGQLVGILILARPTAEDRAAAAEKILRVIASLNKLNNFNDMAAMHAGFSIPAVRRLNGTRDLVDPKCLKMHKYCDKMFSKDNSFKHYKHALDDAEGPTIPLLSVVLSEFAEVDGNDDKKGIIITSTLDDHSELINFKKRLMEYNLIEDIQQYQKTPYNFPIIESLYAVFTSLPSCSEEILYELSLIYEPKKPSISSKLSSKAFKSSRKSSSGNSSPILK